MWPPGPAGSTLLQGACVMPSWDKTMKRAMATAGQSVPQNEEWQALTRGHTGMWEASTSFRSRAASCRRSVGSESLGQAS